MFLEKFYEKQILPSMGERITKNKNPQAVAPIPLWARRLRMAFEQANFIDKKGAIDKKRIGDMFGVGPKAVEHWLNGAREPRYSVLVKIRKLTGISLDYLFGSEDATPFVEDARALANKRKTLN